MKTAFVDAICAEDSIHGIGTCLLLRDYSRFSSDHPRLAKLIPDPYFLCGQLTLMAAGIEMLEANEGDGILDPVFMRPVFDSHEDYSFRFKEGFRSFKEKNPDVGRYLFEPIYEKEQVYRCLQAADLLAYELMRVIDNQLVDPDRQERRAMTRLKVNLGTVYRIDYDALKLIAANQGESTIPLEPIISKRKFTLSRRG